jgi:hypothetical protein
LAGMLFHTEKLVHRDRLGFNGFTRQDCKLFWSIGVLEYWSVGKSESPNFEVNWSFSLLHYSTTPSLQQTAAREERPLKPLRGRTRAGSFGLGIIRKPACSGT